MSRSIALTTSSSKSRVIAVTQESVALCMDAILLVYHELKIELEARCNGSVARVSVKNTECLDTASWQLGWFINQLCASEVEITSFIRGLLHRFHISLSDQFH
jgi:hypothetical protein